MAVDLPFGGELDRFLEVLTAADDRSADRDAAENDLENEGREFARRQADKSHRALAPHHLDRLAESRNRRGRYQRPMRSTAGLLDDPATSHSLSPRRQTRAP